MFQSPTVFVVAAGASAEVGLPVGGELKDRIRSLLNADNRSARSMPLTDPALRHALVRYTQENQVRDRYDLTGQVMEAVEDLRVNMQLAPSIDNYLDACQGDEATITIGKVAIALSILRAEARSGLYYTDMGEPKLPDNNALLRESWFIELWHRLVSGITRATVDSIFSSVAFVVFNYDRCLEHFLFLSLKSYFKIDDNHAAALISQLVIIHPYGKVGALPWQKEDVSSSFGHVDQDNLLTIARELRTFTESTLEGTVGSIRSTISQADTLVFLGFAFHPQNIELMHCRSNITRVFMTTLGNSASDVQIAVKKVSGMIDRPMVNSYERSHNGQCSVITSDSKCSVMFSAHRLRLPM